MMCQEGVVSLKSYCGTAGGILLITVPQVYYEIVPAIWGAILWGPLLYFAILNMALPLIWKFNNPSYQIAVRSCNLGFVFAISVLIAAFATPNWRPFGYYGCFLSFFHYSEYLSIAWANPTTLSLDSFMLNHSLHYHIAAVTSWVEFCVETVFYPQLKCYRFMWIIGISLCIFGEVLRKLAMITARSNFNHVVQYVKNKDHKLITNGVYAYMRHPSYVGWFWWSIGTQIILSNPICILFYTLASWKFFKDRVFIEELTLLQFFGQDYLNYQLQVPTGLPFIKGYEVKQQ